jgi:hypothetical protein
MIWSGEMRYGQRPPARNRTASTENRDQNRILNEVKSVGCLVTIE